MKRIVIIAAIIWSNVSYSATRYELDKTPGNLNIFLTLDSFENRFTIASNVKTHYDHMIASELFSGIYIIKNDTVFLKDSLWMLDIVLLKKGKNLKIIKSLPLLQNRTFVFQREYKEYHPSNRMDQAVFTNMILVNDSLRRIIKNPEFSNVNTTFRKGIFACTGIQSTIEYPIGYSIAFNKDRTYTFKINTELVIRGQWYQKGKYIVLKYKSHDFFAEVISQNEIRSTYIPFIEDYNLLYRK